MTVAEAWAIIEAARLSLPETAPQHRAPLIWVMNRLWKLMQQQFEEQLTPEQKIKLQHIRAVYSYPMDTSA
ncbi:MAG TPA: hypothetical protein VN794_18630 [Methylomirabilota bacterium]|nr:hypothetical protein [Methylomirabilota bacterium]